jgi:death-on-curing protein
VDGLAKCSTSLRVRGVATQGRSLDNAPEDERFDFVVRVATHLGPDLDKIAEQLRAWSYQEA